eukprot:5727924-Pyramimonas_sp.AAC.1
MASCGCSDQSVGLLEEMRAAKLEPSARTFTAVVTAHVAAGVYSLSPSAIGAHYGYILSPLL